MLALGMGGHVLLNGSPLKVICYKSALKVLVGSVGLGRGSNFPIWQARRNKFCSLGLKAQEERGVAETLNSVQAAQLELYMDLLLDWNKRMNLTAVKDRDAVMERHIRDSLSLIPVVEGSNSKRVQQPNKDHLKLLDVGSGAGLPGLIFAIARPAWQVTLLESLKKRCDFLDYVVQTIGLSNVEVIRARAEVSLLKPCHQFSWLFSKPSVQKSSDCIFWCLVFQS
ncbi:hypothetical protein O6H91_21G004500 [Diphasiastrum complanatum]|uniref:Uncharacterized protein n=1 Tax=Diphasiastrum complanatum TaxID=34168 RepID=A0ACC2AH75_DIPCM|nr:hypothetical protein O6H91_21G004500 [Diphasiastrum complanatum]